MSAFLSPSPLRRMAGRGVALAARAIPRHFRLRAACAFVQLYTSVGPRRSDGRYRVDGPLESRLHRLLDKLTRYGCTFDVDLEIVGKDSFDLILNRRGGALLVGPHAMLNALFVRYALDRGVNITGMSQKRDLHVPGTKRPLPVIATGQGSLLRVMNTLRRGNVVGALIDRRAGSGLPEVETEKGPLGIEDSLLRVAARLNVPVIFFSTNMTSKGSVAVHLRTAAGTVEEQREQFIEFVREHVARTPVNPR